jgi:aminoglycoside 3-N-acetyltransferase
MTDKKGLSQTEIEQGFRRIGLDSGQVVLVHSAMRTFGYIEGGADSVMGAFLEVLGPQGTLVAPTFTFCHEIEHDPIIDPLQDRSEMGIITETVRLHPEAKRSTAYRHSFAALGRRRKVITRVDPSLSSFDLRSSFGVMLALDTQIVLLGMPYSTSTSHHFAEWICEVPYRQTLPLEVRVRRPDGSLHPQHMTDYQPKPGAGGAYYDRHTDFNRLGKTLEDQGLVGITAIGNAVVRRFAMRNLIALAEVEAAKDYNIFRVAEGESEDYFTPLDFGKIVLSPEIRDGAGRASQYLWSVVDEEILKEPFPAPEVSLSPE